ncbi:MAG: serine/threonine-protein kinase, partial [Candidatus Eremiobacterota bacterium]
GRGASTAPGFRVASQPSGARVFRVQADLFLSATGQSHTGPREVPVGTTPGPLRVTYQDFPCTLVFRLPLYRDRVVQFPSGAYAPDRQSHPGSIALEPGVPVLAPLLYGLRDWPFLVALVALAAWAGRRAFRARVRERETLAVRERQRQGDFRPGDRVDRWVLGPLLGEGGMARVFRVQGDPVALKILHHEKRERFENEVRAWRSLNHPNIVHLLDWGEVEGQLFLAMELVEGESLARVLQRGPLPVDQAVAVARQVALALEAVHRAGVVHRDLSPNNLMLTPEGAVKLMDFGVAARSDREGQGVQGTVGFSAPDPEPLPASDRYSLGAVLYACLTGRGPFPGGSPLAVLQAQREGRFEPLPESLPGELRRLVHTLLSLDPAERPERVSEALNGP